MNQRYTFREILKNAGFTAVAMLTLAVSPLLLTGAFAGEEKTGNENARALKSAAKPMPAIGIIDVYGARQIPAATILEALQIKEGDAFPQNRDEARQRVAKIPGVSQACLDIVCCDESGRAILFVGIEEPGAKGIQFHPAPTGPIRLRDDILHAGQAFDRAMMDAVRRGDVEEDQSQGHSLAKDPAARAIQEQFIQFSARDHKLLTEVLRFSGDAGHRARAAEIIAYTTNKQSVVADLVHATRDPSAGVRNEAVRALALIAAYAHSNPQFQLRVPWAPFIDLLNSVIWTDRNKASFALMQLSQSRDPALLSQLKAEAMPALMEMARWKSRGHGQPAFVILGRIGGMADDAIFKAWKEGRHQSVIDSILQTQP